MKKKTENSTPTLWQHMRPWGWPLFIRTLGERALLVCDRDLLSQLEGIVSLRCRTMTPQEIESTKKNRQALADIHTVLVFCRRDERSIVRDLRTLYPGKRVFSAQYDLAPNSSGLLKSLPLQMLSSDPVTHKKPILLIATPGGDSDYLAALMEQTGLPRPIEYFGHPLVKLSAEVKNFSPLRYLHSVQKATGAEKTELPLLLHTDVLSALLDNSTLSVHRLKSWLGASGAKIIFLRRDDKLFQAGLTALLEKRPFRSIWSVLPNQRKQFPGLQQSSFVDGMQALSQIARAEQFIEDILKDHPTAVTLSTEDVIAAPMQHLARIADLLGAEIDPAASIQPTAYQEEYADFPGLFDRIIEFRRQYIDRVGLHESARSRPAAL